MIIEQSLKIKKYKCFINEYQGFERIYPINIIIGKNNSGKSTLIDLIEFCVDKSKAIEIRKRSSPNSFEILSEGKIVEGDVRGFPESTTSTGISGFNDKEYGLSLVGKPVRFILNVEEDKVRILEPYDLIVKSADQYLDSIERNILPPLKGKNFQRIAAERDVVAETVLGMGLRIQANGV